MTNRGYYTFHIIMPFSRKYTQEFYINEFRKFNIVWHPVSERPYDWPNEKWIQPLIYDKTGMDITSAPYFAFKKFINGFNIIDDDYYFVMSDDDFLEPNFFNKLIHKPKYCDIPESFIDTNFIIVSLMRGHNMVHTSGYPNDILIANPENMRLFWISLSQIIIKGKILKITHPMIPLNHGSLGDGIYIQNLWGTYPGNNFTFVPEAFQWFNYLEPGRWDNAPTFQNNYEHISNLYL